ncbi:MAG: polymer-forming cytoskeletal protein [Cytophagales bacterium]|nr:MAG: polymer-forming cytoskeletal protein [Cytophagales bacterium]
MAVFGNNTSKDTKTNISSDATNSNTLIGKGAHFEGNIETIGNVRVEGRIIGNTKSKAKIVLGEGSYIDGSILAQNAEISGEVKGQVDISELLILKSTAIINGDINCGKLIVETGAVFNGSCRMGSQVNLETKLQGTKTHENSTETAKIS